MEHEEGQTFATQAADARKITTGPVYDPDAGPGEISVGLVDRLNGDINVLAEIVSMLEAKLESVRASSPVAEKHPGDTETTAVGNLLSELERNTARLSQLFHEIAL